MKVIISRTRNGAWMRTVDSDADSVSRQDSSYEFDEDAEGQDGRSLHGLVEMLHELVDFMGWSGKSRYDRERIQISVVHGDKFECAGCPICKENV